MFDIETEYDRRRMITVMNDAYKRGWITTRDGNISVKTRGMFVISKSGVNKGDMNISDFEESKLINKKIDKSQHKNPSGEFEMHRMLHDSLEDGCVLHLHPTHIISAMYAGYDLAKLSKEFPEVSRYTRVGRNVEYTPVTTYQLAYKTYNTMMAYDVETGSDIMVDDIVGQDRHGICAYGKTPQEAFEHVERLNHICEIVLLSGVKR